MHSTDPGHEPITFLNEMSQSPLKTLTAGTIKWNAIDRVSSQLLYLFVGVVLANLLTQAEFGLVGTLAIFQAFATIFIDSGFGAALLREKEPSQRDYSTVFWFNLAVSLGVYLLLFLGAPLIADMFHGETRLILMSRVMFLSFIINGLAIVQTNRLMKQMNVKMIAISNSAGLIVGGIVGVWLAFAGFGAWAMIWQTIAIAAVKTSILWLTGGWLPSLNFSRESLRKIRTVGFSVFSSALLNTISLNVYNLVVALFYSQATMGVYTQADKWSKMGSASISQVLTSSFVPLLSKVQDSRPDFERYVDKTGRFTSFILLPAMIGLTMIAAPLFHLLFGNKWDEAIPLFQMLTVRGIFIVLISLYNNYLLALGKSRHLIASEIVKDSLIFIAILATIFFGSIDLLILGQLISGILTWLILLKVTAHGILMPTRRLLSSLFPFLAAAMAMAAAAGIAGLFGFMDYTAPQDPSLLKRSLINGAVILAQMAAGAVVYILLLRKTPEFAEAKEYLFHRN